MYDDHEDEARTDTEDRCPRADLVLDLGDHQHSDTCGHALIQHMDHYDYLGDDGELHHLLQKPECCSAHRSLNDDLWISHGQASLRKERFQHDIGSYEKQSFPNSTFEATHGAQAHEHCCCDGHDGVPKVKTSSVPEDQCCVKCPDESLVLDLGDHEHHETCGHEKVEHGDHFDYLGDNGELHHLLETPKCCDTHMSKDKVWISHGQIKGIQAFSAHISSHSPGLGSSDACITKIYAEGICCPMEVPVVEAALGHMPGVVSVEVSVVTKTVTVSHFPALASPAAMVTALNEARLGASLTFPRKATREKASWIPPLHVVIATVLMLISLLHYIAEPAGVSWMVQLKWVALGAVALVLPGIVLKAFGALRHFVFDIHLLITIAAAGAIAIGDYSEAAIVVVLFSVADFLEARCTGQARDAISSVLELKPESAVLAETGECVDASQVEVGTYVLVRSGEKAPLDGIVVAGLSSFDESFLTGESVPIAKGPGDTVRAGTLNSGSGLMTIRTTASAEDTFVAGMARLVEEATSRQSPSEQMVAKFAKVYTPLVLLACILLAFVPWSNPDADRKAWVYLSLQLLVSRPAGILYNAVPDWYHTL